jgi:hypothetical protein
MDSGTSAGLDRSHGSELYSAKRNGDRLVRLGTAAAIFLTAVSFAPGLVSAGETDSATFRIQDYIPKKISDFKWKLDGGANAGSGSSENPTIHNSYSEHDWVSETAASNSRGLNFANNWRYLYETREGFIELALGVSTRFSHRGSESLDSTLDTIGLWEIDRSDQPQSATSFVIPLDGIFRRYILGDGFVTAEGTFDYWYDEQTTKSMTTYRSEDMDSVSGWVEVTDAEREVKSRRISRTIDFAGEIRLGWGRVYDGRYAATALYVISELEKSHLLLRDPDRSEMLDLTRQIHAYREGHSQDQREYRAMTFQAILSSLRSAGLIAEESAFALLCLEDVLDYFPSDERRFGWDVQLGFGGHDRYQNYETDETLKDWTTLSRWHPDSSWVADTISVTYLQNQRYRRNREFTPTDHIVFQIGYYRPLAARWQFDLSARTWWCLNQNAQPEIIAYSPGYRYARTFNRVVTSCDAALQYQFDARTALLVHTALIDTSRTDRYRRFLTGETVDWKVQNRIFSVQLSAAYRMSSATTLRVDWLYSKLINSTKNRDFEVEKRSMSSSISAGITHWLF